MANNEALVPARSRLPSPRKQHGSSNGYGSGPYTPYVDHTITGHEGASTPTAKQATNTRDLESVLTSNDARRIKQYLRDSSWPVNAEIRGPLWLKLCHLAHPQHASIYNEIFTQVFGKDGAAIDVSLPSFVEPGDLHSYHLTNKGIHVAKSIVCIVGHTHPDVTFSPTIFAVTSLFLHYLGEEDTYDCVSSLLSSGQGHITQTKKAYEASRYILRDLAKKFAKPCFVYIMKQGMVVEGVLENWVWWIFRDLPFHYLVRIFDCYLYEGPKILYRVALALMNSFYKYAAKSTKPRSKDVISGGATKADYDISRAISQYCEDIANYISVDKLLKNAFGLRGLTRREIKKYQVKNEMYVSSMHRHGIHQVNFQPQGIPHSVSCESLNLQVSRTRSLSTPVEYPNIKSLLIPQKEWQHIYRWIPTRITVYQPSLLYTTEDHGTSLQTFYNKIQDHEQVLIVIQTTQKEVIGAYCSADWRERLRNGSFSYFGTGETFLFTLSPHRKKYEWVGLKQQKDVAVSAHLFMAGDNTKCSIGGGKGEGLSLQEGFQSGRTEHCLTFNNEPLVETKDFQINIIEVFEFI